ncbi:MAG: VTT domain-containing protein [Candidatus Riflebacteria bacterium]|nr:VTT domain-containing protein [Candidatus Riflebacteria bacterium]
MVHEKWKNSLSNYFKSLVKRNMWSSIGFLIFVIFIFLAFYFYRLPIKAFAKNAVESFGYPALFFLCWASDVIIQPIPADVFVFGTAFGGGNLYKTALVAGFSSVFGGATGYYVGKFFGPWRFRRIFGSKILRNGSQLYKNHGSLAIFIAGVTPIPYSAACWIGGIYGMSITKVVLASWISRTLRYIVVAWFGHIV